VSVNRLSQARGGLPLVPLALFHPDGVVAARAHENLAEDQVESAYQCEQSPGLVMPIGVYAETNTLPSSTFAGKRTTQPLSGATASP
jgi:hypothetical protein